jgi:hypothetical protein
MQNVWNEEPDIKTGETDPNTVSYMVYQISIGVSTPLRNKGASQILGEIFREDGENPKTWDTPAQQSKGLVQRLCEVSGESEWTLEWLEQAVMCGMKEIGQSMLAGLC